MPSKSAATNKRRKKDYKKTRNTQRDTQNGKIEKQNAYKEIQKEL